MANFFDQFLKELNYFTNKYHLEPEKTVDIINDLKLSFPNLPLYQKVSFWIQQGSINISMYFGDYFYCQFLEFYKPGMIEVLNREFITHELPLPPRIFAILFSSQNLKPELIQETILKDLKIIDSLKLKEVHIPCRHPKVSTPLPTPIFVGPYVFALRNNIFSILNRNKLEIDCSQSLLSKWIKSGLFLHIEIREKNTFSETWLDFNTAPNIGSIYLLTSPYSPDFDKEVFLKESQLNFLLIDKIQIKKINKHEIFFKSLFDMLQSLNFDILLTSTYKPVSNFSLTTTQFNTYINKLIKKVLIIKRTNINIRNNYWRKILEFESFNKNQTLTKFDILFEKKEFSIYENMLGDVISSSPKRPDSYQTL